MLYDFIENIKKKKANESVETDKPMGQEMGTEIKQQTPCEI